MVWSTKLVVQHVLKHARLAVALVLPVQYHALKAVIALTVQYFTMAPALNQKRVLVWLTVRSTRTVHL